VTRAAIEAAGDVTDLWIVADDEGHAKELYARLGFLEVWTRMQLLRPGVSAPDPPERLDRKLGS
jgi:hypothetical protein